MPELAEVETVRKVLKKKVLNKPIKDITIYYPKMIENDLNSFKSNLINQEFIDIKRKGKYLLFETEEYFLISHLRMEGKFYYIDDTEPIYKHEHLKFTFKDNSSLRYIDTRKFGRMYLTKKEQVLNYPGLKKLGPDANSNNIDEKEIFKKVKNKTKPIKTILLDQDIISGLGNIYVDEVLFASNIKPNKPGNKITLKDIKSILNNSKTILDEAIKCGGTTIRSYTSSLGVTGSYQNHLCVHTKSICPKCNSNISKMKIGGRTTYYCSKCQK